MAINALGELSAPERRRFAYLALTGKLEGAVRDHLATWIQMNHGDAVLVGRDLSPAGFKLVGDGLKRALLDLVVVPRGDGALEIVEAKQFYTFDYRVESPCLVTDLRQQIIKDANRLRQASLCRPGIVARLLLIACHITAIDPDPLYETVTKYKIHSDRRSRGADHSHDFARGFEADDDLAHWTFESADSLALGECFGYGVTLLPIIGKLRP